MQLLKGITVNGGKSMKSLVPSLKNDGWEALTAGNHRGPKTLILWNKGSLQENVVSGENDKVTFCCEMF